MLYYGLKRQMLRPGVQRNRDSKSKVKILVVFKRRRFVTVVEEEDAL